MVSLGFTTTSAPRASVTMPKKSTHPHDFPMMRRMSRCSEVTSSPSGLDMATSPLGRRIPAWAPATCCRG